MTEPPTLTGPVTSARDLQAIPGRDIKFQFNHLSMFGAWRSLVAHLLWEQGVGGSNPLAPTSKIKGLREKPEPFFLGLLEKYQEKYQVLMSQGPTLGGRSAHLFSGNAAPFSRRPVFPVAQVASIDVGEQGRTETVIGNHQKSITLTPGSRL